jgi:exodeoxyribonuclease V gamma subunit
VQPDVDALVTAAHDELALDGSAGSVNVRLALGDGRLLVGTVPGVRGGVVGEVTFSRLAPKHRLTAWVRLLALAAHDPAAGYRAVTLGRRRSDGPRAATVSVSTLEPPTPATAGAQLQVLVDLYDRGLREPLPLPCDTAAAYATAALAGGDPVAAAQRAWQSDRFAREDREPEWVLVLGGSPRLAELLREPPRDDERGPGWDEADRTRLGRCARRLWSGLLACEALVDR